MEHDESVFQPNPALPDTGKRLCIRSGKTEKLIHKETPCRDDMPTKHIGNTPIYQTGNSDR